MTKPRLDPDIARRLSAVPRDKPIVASLCGTFLKPEMQSVYRQVTGLREWRTVVLTEQRQNADRFPFDPVVSLRKRGFRPRGNFLRRFYWKHVRGQWPPPGWVEPVPPRDFEFCDLVPVLNALKPDVLHIYYGHKARKYLPLVERWGGPLLVSFHGVDVAGDEDKANYGATFEELFAYAGIVAARSESLLDRLRQMGCPDDKLRLNRTPLPLDFVVATPRTPPDPEDGRWRLVQACRLIRKKGLLTTIAALETVVKRWPQTTFTLAGDGPMRSEVQAAAQSAGLGECVRFAGWMDQAALRELFMQSHVFLHPSETTKTGDTEGVPNSMVEAMAAGLPVVATRHGGIPEAMTDGVDGVLVPERNPEALAAGLLRLMEDPAFYRSCAGNAPQTAVQRFGLEGRIAALEDCYTAARGT